MSAKIIVNKFGGGIMIPHFIPLIKTRLQNQLNSNYRPVVVVSALKGVTDLLLAGLNRLQTNPPRATRAKLIASLIKNLLRRHQVALAAATVKAPRRAEIKSALVKILSDLQKDLTAFNPARAAAREEDKIVASGEKLAAALLAGALAASGLKAVKILAEDIPLLTDDNFKNAAILYGRAAINARKKLLPLKSIPVIAGFTGQTASGQTTTLGRGGTDTTACFLGSALRAEKIILWKDVPGVFSADPKLNPRAQPLAFIDYAAAEKVGKIIHAKAIQYIKKFRTRAEIIYIKNPKQKTIIGPRRAAKQ